MCAEENRSDERGMARRDFLRIGGSLFIFGGIAAVAGCVPIEEEGVTTNPVELKKDDRILIVAPHPDDETLGPGGLIHSAVGKGIPVRVVMMTTGDGYKHATQVEFHVDEPAPADYQRMADVRHFETLAAMRLLGLRDEDVSFLAFGDGSVNSLWRGNWDDDNPHLSLNGATSVPYAFAYRQGTPYAGQEVVNSLVSILKEFNPTLIVYPCAEDVHHDHWATHAFVQYALIMAGQTPREITYLVHRGANWSWPTPSEYKPDDPLEPPDDLKKLQAQWLAHELPEKSRLMKREAVKDYKSQLPLADLFLESFVRRNELFIEYSKETLAKVSGVPDLSAKELKGRILRDPVEDSLIFRLHEGADLREVWLFTAGNRLWLVAGLGGKMEPDVVYQFGLRAIKSGTAEHLDVRVLDNKISVLDLGRLWTTKDVGFQYMEPKRVAVSVPIDFIDGASHVMVNVETYGRTTDENHWIDRTAWRTVKVK